jgi:flagellin
MRGLVVKLADDTTSTNDRSNYQAQYAELSNNVTTFIKDSVYNGNTLIDGGGATSASGNTNLATDANFASIRVSRNESGGTYTLQSGDVNGTLDSILFTTAALAGGGLTAGAPGAAGTQDATAASLITAAPNGVSVFDKAVALINTQLNQVGSEVNSVKAQVSYNSDKMDALNAGVGSLVDADLAKESAQLQALQIRQQLGTQSLAIANQAPAALLSLFK